MLYLHCGWPKTGTSSLQATLAKYRDRLANEGVVYPDRWTRGGDDAHKLFATDRKPDAVIGELKTFLEAHADRDVLLSNEILSLRLYKGEFREVLVNLIVTAHQVMPVRCIWFLRRFDDLVNSACLYRAMAGLKSVVPACVRDLDPNPLFIGMREMVEAADEVAYIRYDFGGSYEADMPTVLGVPRAVAHVVCRELESTPRLNSSPSQKEMTVLLNLRTLSARCGAELDVRLLREVFAAGGFRFEGDCRCDLFGTTFRRELHTRALASARECGISAYGDFFGDAEIAKSSAPPRFDPNSLSDKDLSRLQAHLHERLLSESHV
jgi:hypothetical protein